MLSKLKLYGWAVLAFVLAGLGIFGRTMKGQRDKARIERDTAVAVVHAQKTIKKIEKEKKKELSRKESEIKERIKNGEDPKNLDDLFNNDGW